MMKTPLRILGLIALFSVGLPVLAAKKVTIVAAKDADFAHYSTYQWLPPRVLVSSGIEENHPHNPILKAVIGRHLALQGLKEVAEEGDLLIQAYVFTESVPQLEAVLFAGGVNLEFGTVVGAMGRYNREGTLCVNLIDRRTKKSAWAGMTTQSLERGTLPPEKVHSKLEKAAETIFKKYPVKK